MKKVLFIQETIERHWVGDGFPVRTIFSYTDIGQEMSPFLLMDYAGPETFPASKHARGVGEHPHRGIETVTIVYDGEVEHKDSAGGGGAIGPGDVQWMTAASGVVHEEMHGENFAKNGGRFEMIQLWVNLPKKDKMSKPRYQDIRSSQIPNIELAGGAGLVRVIAGSFQGENGPAKTFTPVELWDTRLASGHTTKFQVKDGHTVAVFVLSGEIKVADDKRLTEGMMAVLDRSGTDFLVETLKDAKILILGGLPLNEPIVGYGPFVMNTKEEIQTAFTDYQMGKMGHLKS